MTRSAEPMTCDQLESTFFDECAGIPLSAHRLKARDEHLATCPDCRRLVETLEMMHFDGSDDHAEPLDAVSRRRLVLSAAARSALPDANRSDNAHIHSPQRRWIWIVASSVVLVGLIALHLYIYLRPANDQQRIVTNKHSGPRRQLVARLVMLSGEVRTSGGYASLKEPLPAGRTVRVAKGGQAALVLPTGDGCLLGPASVLRLDQMQNKHTFLTLSQGKLMVSVIKNGTNRTFSVITPAGRVEVTGTLFTLSVQRQLVKLTVLSGQVQVSAKSRAKVVVRSGEALTLGRDSIRALSATEIRSTRLRARQLESFQASTSTTLIVHTVPTGATVNVDDIIIGTTPLDARVRSGHRELTVTRPGYVSRQEFIELATGETASRSYSLDRITAQPTSQPIDPTVPRIVIKQRGKTPPSVVQRGRTEPDGALQHLPPSSPKIPKNLMLLAQKRRLAKDWAGAANVYRRLIREYPRSGDARVALVSLGTILLKHLRKPRAALASFDRYLRGSRHGALAQVAAFGRSVALRALGQRCAEMKALKDYSRRYPSSLRLPQVKRRLGQLKLAAKRAQQSCP